ncbi:MAG: VWA domain-containing protein [Bacteroidales bacterium]|nr:VWA domain-containing protein [Bacteroidales bacterium]
MNDITFGNIENLWYLLFIPAFFVLFSFVRYQRKIQLKKLGQTNIVKTLIKENSRIRPWFKFSALMLAISLLIFATSRPQFVTETKVDANSGNEIIIALDISNSMLASSDNAGLERLEMAKNAIFKLIDNLNNEKLGLIVFAGQAVMQIPLTNDYSAFKIILKSINPGFISAQGTAIGDAIDLANNSFTPDSKNQKSMIIISDGEDHEGNIEQACNDAQQKGIKIYTVGIGSNRGNPIYIDGEVLKDKSGNIVMSKLNEDVLKQIAKETDGEYTNFDNKIQSLKQVYENMNQTDADGTTKVAKYDEKFHYFVFPAFLLLLFEFFILYRKNRWLQKINIFKN